MKSCDEDRAIYNGHYEVSVAIQAPPAKIWPILIDDSLWILSHAVIVISGETGTVGCVTRVTPKMTSWTDTPPPHHHYCKVIKIVPLQQHILKTYTEREGAYGMHLTAFDDTRLLAVNDRTEVIFNVYLEAMSAAIAEDPEPMDKMMELSRKGMIMNLNNLRHLIEGS